mmetsp:Transcript_8506/g.16064  ORF Transcript_8506/g.16064 Transcript_8506/m.16064 type:complete len:217 (-) Transcript_8506:1950-2600(-)
MMLFRMLAAMERHELNALRNRPLTSPISQQFNECSIPCCARASFCDSSERVCPRTASCLVCASARYVRSFSASRFSSPSWHRCAKACVKCVFQRRKQTWRNPECWPSAHWPNASSTDAYLFCFSAFNRQCLANKWKTSDFKALLSPRTRIRSAMKTCSRATSNFVLCRSCSARISMRLLACSPLSNSSNDCRNSSKDFVCRLSPFQAVKQECRAQR